MIDRLLIAGALERLSHVADRKAQMPHRTVAQEPDPVRRRLVRRIDLAHHRRFGLRRSAHSLGPGHADRRAHHAFGDHRHRHRRAADDVDRRALRWSLVAELQDVAPDIALNERRDALRRDADQHDRLVMRHQSRAGDLALRRQSHEDLDRLAGVAGRVHPVGVDEGVADHFLSSEHFYDRGTALRRPVMIGAGNKLPSRDLTDEFGEPALQRKARFSHRYQNKQRQGKGRYFGYIFQSSSRSG